MQNIVMNMCEKYHYNRLRNDRALGNAQPDNNKNNVVALADPFPGPKKYAGAPWSPLGAATALGEFSSQVRRQMHAQTQHTLATCA